MPGVTFEKPELRELFAGLDLADLRNEYEWVKQRIMTTAATAHEALPRTAALAFDVSCFVSLLHSFVNGEIRLI